MSYSNCNKHDWSDNPGGIGVCPHCLDDAKTQRDAYLQRAESAEQESRGYKSERDTARFRHEQTIEWCDRQKEPSMCRFDKIALIVGLGLLICAGIASVLGLFD